MSALAPRGFAPPHETGDKVNNSGLYAFSLNRRARNYDNEANCCQTPKPRT